MPRKKTTKEEEFQVYIEKDPQNLDTYRPAEWTKDRKHSYWLSYYSARKNEIEAEEQYLKTGNAEFLRKARIYSHYKQKLIYEGVNLEAKQAPYQEIDKEPTALTVWPPRPRIEELVDTCDTEERELERIFGHKYSVVRRDPDSNKRKRKTPEKSNAATTSTTTKKRKVTPPKKTTTKAPAKTSIINLVDNQPISTGAEPPKTNLSTHQKNKAAGKTPPPINTTFDWRDLPPITLYSSRNNNHSTETITSHQPVR